MEASTAVKQEVVEMVKQMSCYFTQIYEVKVRVAPGICRARYLICPARYLTCDAPCLALILA